MLHDLPDSNGNYDGYPDELLIMTENNLGSGTNKIWRWNTSGLGYSSQGYANGNWGELAISSKGVINASFITAGTLDAKQAEITNINAGEITVGQMKCGIVEDTDGEKHEVAISFIDGSGNPVVAIDKDGIHANAITTGTLNADFVKGGTLKGVLIKGNEIQGGYIHGADVVCGDSDWIEMSSSGIYVGTDYISPYMTGEHDYGGYSGWGLSALVQVDVPWWSPDYIWMKFINGILVAVYTS